jgi:hypoxanthine phosphoribosyltransferase
MRGMRPTVLLPAADLQHRVRALGALLTAELAGRNALILGLLDGACMFTADVVRAINLPDLELRFVRAGSYTGTMSTGTVVLGGLPVVTGRHVVVVDDILDTGRTLATVVAALGQAGAASIRTCVLLDKPARRVPAGLAHADHVGFTIADRFVVGYGLDHDGRWRQLPDVCVLD